MIERERERKNENEKNGKKVLGKQRLNRRHFITLYLHNIIVYSFHHFHSVESGAMAAELKFSCDKCWKMEATAENLNLKN